MRESRNCREIEIDEFDPNIKELEMEPEIQLSEGSTTQVLRKLNRISKPPERLFLTFDMRLDVLFLKETYLTTYKEAILDIVSGKWQEAMKSEIDYMHDKANISRSVKELGGDLV